MSNSTGLAPAWAATVAKRRSVVCFLCKWISEDVSAHGKLTGYPFDYVGNPVFPVEGKERHLALESGSIDNLIV